MSPKKITLYVDIISPFGYLAYWLTRNSAVFSKSDIQITYIPILLGGIMQSAGNTPPIEIKNKDKWIGKERERWAKSLKIPISDVMPKPFPQSTVATQRALCFVEKEQPEKLTQAIDALYKAFWVDGKGPIAKPEVIGEALEPVFGKEGVKKVLEGSKSDAAKSGLKDNTARAFKEGAFGLPWFVATNGEGKTEGFWGVDHIGQMLEFLGVEVQGEGGRYRSML